MTTLRERPVTSSSCSCMVTPSMMSPYFTTPGTSVTIGIENGSHSESSLPAGGHRLALFHEQAGAVDQPVPLALTARLVLDDDLAVPVHDHLIVLLADHLGVLEPDVALGAGLERALLGADLTDAADVER